MNDECLGRIAFGVRMPLVTPNCGLVDMIVDSVLKATETSGMTLNDGDIIGITESIVARANGLYISVDDIANDLKKKFNNPESIVVMRPIFSRNRFSLILKGIARATKKVYLLLNETTDEVGNKIFNPYTKVNIVDFYRELIEAEGAEAVIMLKQNELDKYICTEEGVRNFIIATIHTREENKLTWNEYLEYFGIAGESTVLTLADICSDRNPDYGVLGTNKANEEQLKLFPTKEVAKEVTDAVVGQIKEKLGVNVEGIVCGDGCFKSSDGIWELADPEPAPYYTPGLTGTPNEVKLKYLIDSPNFNTEEDVKAIIKNSCDVDLKGAMISQGTTPRKVPDIVASLGDLIMTSGHAGTPVFVIKNFKKTYAD